MNRVSPAVQMVIPVHSATRPIRRAVESVLQSPEAGVIVVAHGLAAADLDLPNDERVTVVHKEDGLGFPGVAFNAGLAATTAPWVGIMGSDDWYEPGAIEAMLYRADAANADVVLAPLRHAHSKRNSLNPLTWRRNKLSAQRDGLFFRTAPLGIFRRGIFEDAKFHFREDVIAGIDHETSARLYTAGFSISHYPSDPAYVIGDEAKDRVTTIRNSLSVHNAAWKEMWESNAILALKPKDRRALAQKFLLAHVLATASTRSSSESWDDDDFAWLVSLSRHVKELEPKADVGLVRARARVLDALLAGSLDDMLRALETASYMDWRRPATWWECLAQESWLRRAARGWASRVRDRLEKRPPSIERSHTK